MAARFYPQAAVVQRGYAANLIFFETRLASTRSIHAGLGAAWLERRMGIARWACLFLFFQHRYLLLIVFVMAVFGEEHADAEQYQDKGPPDAQ